MEYPIKKENLRFSRQKLAPWIVITICLTIVISFITPKKKTLHIAQDLSLPQPALQHTHDASDAVDENWQAIQTQPGDSLASLFKQMGLSPQVLHLVMSNNPHVKQLTNIKPNQTVQFLIRDTRLEQLILPLSTSQSLTVKRKGEAFETKIKTHKTYTKPDVVRATVHHSLYTTAKNAKIPYALIRQMTEILAWQINFAREVREGDHFTIQYEGHYIENQFIRTGDVLAVAYTHNGTTYHAIRHQTKDGRTDYFTPEGKSVRKAFTRYPIKFSHISSGFNLARMHPILKQRRPHRGIDLAAPIGTPIKATSDGRVVSIGYDNGYGNKIKIRHAGPYDSLYAHLLKFQKGLKRGDKVKRGDIIGYVGQTGLADGPHCHYEFHVNNIPRNPATVKLPDAEPIPTAELAAFKLSASTAVASLEGTSAPQKEVS